MITIEKAHAESMLGSKLNYMALGEVANTLAGSSEEQIVNSTLAALWKSDRNRFSHRYAFEAKLDGNTLGVVTCLPVKLLNRLAWPTFQQLLLFRKWSLIRYNLENFKALKSTIALNEGNEDEYHIAALATMPESRGLGVGSRLIEFAEQQAILHGFAKCSLTVKKENHGAKRLYERLGYRITGESNQPTIQVYQMSKPLVHV